MLSSRDGFQVLKDVHDPANNRLRVDAQVTVTPPSNLEVVIDHQNDSIQVGDGVDLLEVNTDGSINVNLVDSTVRTIVNTFNEITSVASSLETILVTYIVPIGKVAYLTNIDVAGTNIASYKIQKNLSTISKLYTYFGSSLNAFANFGVDLTGTPGLKLLAGDTITVKVLHGRPTVGDFNGRIQVVEV
jgi:hypothetical protein